MDIHQIKKYWVHIEEAVHVYRPSQLDNPRILKNTIDFLVNCGLPVSCAPGLSFDNCNNATIPTPNQVLNIDINGLNDYLMIGSNGNGDPICIDLNNENEIVYLNHDNYFERIYINRSVHQLTECIIRYRNFYASLDPRFENDTFIKRKFSNEEFYKVCDDFKEIDEKSLLDTNCWRAELDYLLWERDNQ